MIQVPGLWKIMADQVAVDEYKMGVEEVLAEVHSMAKNNVTNYKEVEKHS